MSASDRAADCCCNTSNVPIAMTKKRALLVFPDYNSGLSEREQFVMQQAGVLPPSLGEYTPHGAAADRDKLLGVFGPGFATTVLWGEITARDLTNQLRLLLARDTSVAVLAFCGHGVYEPAPGRHGALVCSFNQRVSAATVDSVAAEQRFCGTFVRILNMCDASADAVPCDASAEPIGGRAQAALPRAPHAAPRGMVISASAAFTSTGSHLVKALGALFPKAMVTYECVASLLNSGRVGSELVILGALDALTDSGTVAALDKNLKVSVSVTPGLCGVFGCSAFQASGAIACTPSHLHDEGESDVEL